MHGTRLCVAALSALSSCAAAPAAVPTPTRDPAVFEYLASQEPAFLALRQAVEAGDDSLARQIAARIRARRPTAMVLRELQAWELLLEARAAAQALHLVLLVEPIGPDRLRIDLSAHSDLKVPVRVVAAGALLRSAYLTVDERGSEHFGASTLEVQSALDFEIQPERATRIELQQVDLPLGRALALRVRLGLNLVPGALQIGEQSLPLAGLEVQDGDWTRLAAHLPTQPVEPAELVRYLTQPSFNLPAALERAVRIPAAQRAAALDLVAARVDELALPDLERAAPVFRWLTGDRELGHDPEAWRAWLQARAAQAARVESALVLPDAPR